MVLGISTGLCGPTLVPFGEDFGGAGYSRVVFLAWFLWGITADALRSISLQILCNSDCDSCGGVK